MGLHLRVRSQPSLSLSLLHTRQPASPGVVSLHLRLSEARVPPHNSAAPFDFGDVEVRLDRTFELDDVFEFLRPGKARRAVRSVLSACRSVWPVGEGTFALLAQRVSDDFTYSAAKAMSMPPCDVKGEVHIFRVPATYGTGVAAGGGLGRALLDSREAHDREYWGAFGGVPASEAAIEGLETAAYPGSKGEDRCVVCCEEFAPPREVKKTPCGHLFHGECIVQWLQRSNRCPLCRFEMPRAEAAAAAPSTS